MQNFFKPIFENNKIGIRLTTLLLFAFTYGGVIARDIATTSSGKQSQKQYNVMDILEDGNKVNSFKIRSMIANYIEAQKGATNVNILGYKGEDVVFEMRGTGNEFEINDSGVFKTVKEEDVEKVLDQKLDNISAILVELNQDDGSCITQTVIAFTDSGQNTFQLNTLGQSFQSPLGNAYYTTSDLIHPHTVIMTVSRSGATQIGEYAVETFKHYEKLCQES